MNHFSGILIPLLSFLTFTALAQPSVEKAPIDTLKQYSLSEITIKSPKETRNVSQLPASISIVTSKALEGGEVRNIKDLSAALPNFFMPDYGSKLTSPVYIRGIGSRINAPSVGIYVDGVPYFEKSAFDFDFFDLDRIEVLRGPQGTLYGRNTMGGIINIFTKSPLTEQGSAIKLSAATYGNYTGSFNHYGKIGEKSGFSLNGSYTHRDGFFTNAYLGNKVDALNSVAGRARYLYQPNDRLTLENTASYEYSDQGGYPYILKSDTVTQVKYDQYSYYRRALFSDAFLVTYANDKFKIQSTSSFQLMNDRQGIDQDFTPKHSYYVVQEQLHKMGSQEVVIRSNNDKSYEWLFGAYGFVQQYNNNVDVNYYTLKSHTEKGYNHTIAGGALFHQSVFNDFIFPNLTLTTGLRLDFEHDQLDYTYDIMKSTGWVNQVDTVYPSLKDARLLPKISLAYRLGHSSIYASATNGYKTGGFNNTFERPEDLRFDPETSWNYELGWRSPLLGNLLYADAALFYIDWRNQQIYQTVPSGKGSMLKNAGQSESKGFELSLRTSPFKGYEINANYGYTEATFIKYVVDSKTSYSGNYIPYIPRHTLGASITKTIVMNTPAIDRLRLNVTYRETGKLYWTEANTDLQNCYGLLDAKMSAQKGAFEVELWAKNITDTHYQAFFFTGLGNRYYQPGRPSQVGVNLTYRF